MKFAAGSGRRLVLKPFSMLWLGCSLAVAGTLSCSVPNLEKPQCTEARLATRRFYSFHFGTDMMMTTENLKAKERFLTQELFRSLSSESESRADYFTASESYPKAFRIGACTSDSPDRADLQVVLMWRDDSGSDQKEVHAELIKSGNDWLVNKVSK